MSTTTKELALQDSIRQELAAIDRPTGSRAVKDRLATILVWAAFVLAMIPLASILYTAASKGISLILTASWWSQNQRGITSEDVGGGALHAIEGTLIQGLVTSLIAIPIGVLTAIYLVEYGRGRLAKGISLMVDILSGVPSIVAALFIYAVWVTTFGFKRVGFAVALSLVLLMIPVIVRSTEEMLKLVPNELREASLALGVPRWKTIAKVVLPTAFSGIVTGALLGMARVMGETAPLLILGPYTKSFNVNLFEGNMATLPTMIYQDRGDIALSSAADRMWATALTLILLILVLNLIGRLIGRIGAVKT